MKIALVHDYLKEYGGAERVVEAMHDIWPDAPLYTSFVDWSGLGRHADRFKTWDIRTSWVQSYGFIKRWISPLRFLAPSIWNSFNLSDYDVVLSSSGWFMCRGVHVQKPAIHICYIHHPPRHMYGYATGSTLQKYPPVRAYAAVLNFFLRHYDFQTAQKVDYFIANSQETARRVEKFYRRTSTVIYPPVKSFQFPVSNSQLAKIHGNYYLSVGRLTYAKRIDVIIETCNRLALPLKVVGIGKDEEALKKLAGPTIEFVGSVSDEELDEIYQGAKALIFCALDEDFGMVPVEAMGHGIPVIALAQGGVKETVIDGKTGILFDHPTVESLTQAMKKSDVLIGKKSTKDACIAQANTFSTEKFRKQLVEFVTTTYNKSTSR